MRSRPLKIAAAAVLLVLAGCADGSSQAHGPQGAGTSGRAPDEPGRDAGAEPGRGGEPVDAAPATIAIRRGRVTARVDVSSGAPDLVLGGATYRLVREDGSFDRESAERMFAALEAAGEFLEIELIMPSDVPGKVVEQMVFFLEEKGRVPIVSSPGEEPVEDP